MGARTKPYTRRNTRKRGEPYLMLVVPTTPPKKLQCECNGIPHDPERYPTNLVPTSTVKIDHPLDLLTVLPRISCGNCGIPVLGKNKVVSQLLYATFMCSHRYCMKCIEKVLDSDRCFPCGGRKLIPREFSLEGPVHWKVVPGNNK